MVATIRWCEDDDDSVSSWAAQVADSQPHGSAEDVYYSRRIDARARTDEEWIEIGWKATFLAGLVDTWTGLVRTGGYENIDGQLDQLFTDLGSMPSPTQRPGALSMWVGALINPLPKCAAAPCAVVVADWCRESAHVARV